MQWLLPGLIGLVIGGVTCFFLGIRYRLGVERNTMGEAEERARTIENDAHKRAEARMREKMLEANESIQRDRSEYEREVKERRADLQRQENRLQQKEDNIDRKLETIEKKEESLAQKHAAIDRTTQEIEALKKGQAEMLEKISGFTVEQAKEYLIAQVESQVTHETAAKIKEIESRLRYHYRAGEEKTAHNERQDRRKIFPANDERET
jgi:ribonuclease Y